MSAAARSGRKDDVRIRPADPKDAPALAAFAARLFSQTYARGGDTAVATSRPEDVAAYVATHFTQARLEAELRDPALRTLVAESDGEGEWAGYAQLRVQPSADAPVPSSCAGSAPRELARLYVDQRWQGRGVAARLLNTLRQMAVALPGGADPLWLSAYQANARAIAFYRREGFTVAGETTFSMGAEVQRDWLMVWRG